MPPNLLGLTAEHAGRPDSAVQQTAGLHTPAILGFHAQAILKKAHRPTVSTGFTPWRPGDYLA